MNNVLVFLSFLFLCQLSYGDIVPPNSHLVDKCVKIINIDDFPDYCLLAYIVHPVGNHIDTYIIDSQTCLHKGYKFNSIKILAIKKNYLQGKDLRTTDWLNKKYVLRSSIDIEPYGGYVDNDNPTSAIDEDYKIAGFTKSSLLLYKCREYTRFINGHPALIRSYNSAGATITDSTVYIIPNLQFGTNQEQPPSHIWSFLVALLYTILIETIILVIIVKTRLKHIPISYGSLLLTGILCSLSTLPYVWFVIPYFIKPTMAYMIISELSVMAIESLLLYKLLPLPYKTALFISAICNTGSFVCGLVINYFFHSIV